MTTFLQIREFFVTKWPVLGMLCLVFFLVLLLVAGVYWIIRRR
jgi:hypothetical protein